jgi:SAM-dependent methyltransferase
MKKTRDIFYSLSKLSKKWENYFDIYDRYLSTYVGKNPTILEVGIAHGGGTELLLEYFDRDVTLYGIDYDTRFLDHKFGDARVYHEFGDQSKPEFWKSYLTNKPDFDIIIDDGGHEMMEQIITLISTFPRLKDGGIYIVEDTHTSYWEQWNGGFDKSNTFVSFAKSLVELLHKDHIKDRSAPQDLINIFTNLKCVTFYNSVTILEKGPTLPAKEAVSDKNSVVEEKPKEGKTLFNWSRSIQI